MVTYTESGWQTPESRVKFIEKIVVPHKNRKIERMGLSPDQWSMLIVDLHYSHKDKAVIKVCNDNHIALLFIGAGATDTTQVGDTTVNAPFKRYISSAYSRYLLTSWETAHNDENVDFESWIPDLSIKTMKPKVIEFIGEALDKLRNDDMKAAISSAFKSHGQLGLMYSEEEQAKARQYLQQEKMELDEAVKMAAEDIRLPNFRIDDDDITDEDVEEIDHEANDETAAVGDRAFQVVEQAAVQVIKRIKFV